MARKPKKQGKKRPSPLQRMDREIDRFLEGDTGALSPQTRQKAKPESYALAPPVPAPPRGDIPAPPDEAGDQAPLPEPAPQRPPLDLDISDGGLTAVLRVVSPEHTQEDILDCLKQHGVTVGISEPDIQKALKTVRQDGAPIRDIVVARGTPPKPPAPARIEYRPPAGLDALPSLAPVRKLLDVQDRNELRRTGAAVAAWAVRPGHLLAVQVSAPGEPGITVQGQPIPPPAREDDGQNPQLQPGTGVELSPDGAGYLARIYGYAGLLDGKISVLPPIWIAPDATEAYFLNLSRLSDSPPPAIDDLRTALEASGVSAGVDAAAIAALCEGLKTEKLHDILFPLAHRRSPQPPVDAAITFSFPHRPQAGAVQEDGSIDFKARNLFPSVRKDALLAECTPPVPGAPGQTVRGDEIPVTAPMPVELIAAEGVRLEEQDGIQRLYAETDGGVGIQTAETHTPDGPLKRYTIAVRPTVQIPGNVNYETGNIDLRGNVEIRGSVAGGFRVIATGDITVSGSVDAGAEVKSGGNITVRQGIVGRKTRVAASGAIAARFIQDARIQAGGDILVGSYIHSARVRSSGHVRVEGRGGSGGGIVGGETWALSGIASRNLGSEQSATTRLVTGVDPDLHRRYEHAVQMARQAGVLLDNLLKAIGLPALKAETVRRLIARNPGRKQVILHYVKKANQLAQAREKYLQEQRDLKAQISDTAKEASVDVAGTAYARVRLQIGSEQTVLQSDLERVRFHIDPDGETPGIFWTDLSV